MFISFWFTFVIFIKLINIWNLLYNIVYIELINVGSLIINISININNNIVISSIQSLIILILQLKIIMNNGISIVLYAILYISRKFHLLIFIFISLNLVN